MAGRGNGWIWLAIGAATAGALVVLLLEGLSSPHDNTLFAPTFDRRAFTLVRPGDPAERVRALLGEPLERLPEHDGLQRWRYTHPRRSPHHTVRFDVLIRDDSNTVAHTETQVQMDYLHHITRGGNLFEF